MEAAGPGVASPAVGDLVVLSWLAPCRLCVACQRGQAAYPWPLSAPGYDPFASVLD